MSNTCHDFTEGCKFIGLDDLLEPIVGFLAQANLRRDILRR